MENYYEQGRLRPLFFVMQTVLSSRIYLTGKQEQPVQQEKNKSPMIICFLQSDTGHIFSQNQAQSYCFQQVSQATGNGKANQISWTIQLLLTTPEDGPHTAC